MNQFFLQRGKGHWAVYYTCPQSFIITFSYSFVGSTNFGTILNFDLFVKLSVYNFQPLIVIYRRGILCIIIGGVHQFIGHCLIPLDPCFFLQVVVSSLIGYHFRTRTCTMKNSGIVNIFIFVENWI